METLGEFPHLTDGIPKEAVYVQLLVCACMHMHMCAHVYVHVFPLQPHNE